MINMLTNMLIISDHKEETMETDKTSQSDTFLKMVVIAMGVGLCGFLVYMAFV
jgi:hypothetical protein